MNRTRSIAVAIAMSVLLPQFANAQAGTGAVRGQVVDSQSRAIVGGRVAITDENNRLVRTQLTGGLGEFTFVGLPPATYRIDCEAVGFKKLTIEHVAAAVDSTVEVPLRLEVGDVAQSVTVAAGQGDRNVFRLPHHSTMDAGLAKTFRLPKLESHTLQLRREVFNVTNSQPFGSLVYSSIGQDPFENQPQATWGRFGGSQNPSARAGQDESCSSACGTHSKGPT